MPVTTTHAQYELWAPLWQKIRDCTAGEYAIKEKGQVYLPKLSGMDYDDYRVYLENARFYNATARTIQGLLGAVFRVPPVPHIPALMEPWLEDITLTGLPFDAFLKKEVEDKLQTARYGLLVDLSEETGRPYLAPYTAENIINWWPEDRIHGIQQPTLIVLREYVSAPGKDEFSREEEELYRVLEVIEGRYRVRVYRKTGPREEWMLTEELFPSRGGEPLDFIPFIFDGATDLTPDCEKPTLLDLASLNLGHYRLTADYYDALLFTSKPQPWVSGVSNQTKELRIGSRVAWTLPQGATAGYLEYSGAGISSIREALLDDEGRMARLGASVLERPKEGVEAAETARINQAGKVSVLSSIVGTTGQAFTKALQYMAWWGRLTNTLEEKEVGVSMNMDFIEARLSPQDLLALVQAWQARGLSQDTYLYNVQRGGLLPEGRTLEEEKDLIEQQSPVLTASPDTLGT